MATKKADAPDAEITIAELKFGRLDLHIIGQTPMIMHRLSEKAKHELLFPAPKKTAADKASNLKHDPLAEFRASPYILRQPDAPTLLGVPANAFKGAMRTAALRLPGTKKTEIGQLVAVDGYTLPVWGVPQIFCAITRSADMNKTPDVRTRAILPEWAAKISVTYVKPNLKDQAIANLVAAAGVVAGIGDWRQEKGSGNFGMFRVCDAEDPDYLRIISEGGKAAQQAAMDAPQAYDDDTEELLAWFNVETKRRGFKVAA